jgi:hypothetical protein
VEKKGKIQEEERALIERHLNIKNGGRANERKFLRAQAQDKNIKGKKAGSYTQRTKFEYKYTDMLIHARRHTTQIGSLREH